MIICKALKLEGEDCGEVGGSDDMVSVGLAGSRCFVDNRQ